MADLSEVAYFSAPEIVDFCKKHYILLTSVVVSGETNSCAPLYQLLGYVLVLSPFTDYLLSVEETPCVSTTDSL